MRLGRTVPELETCLVLEPGEWRAAFILKKKPVPKKMPTLKQVLRLSAQRGGSWTTGSLGKKELWRWLQGLKRHRYLPPCHKYKWRFHDEIAIKIKASNKAIIRIFCKKHQDSKIWKKKFLKKECWHSQKRLYSSPQYVLGGVRWTSQSICVNECSKEEYLCRWFRIFLMKAMCLLTRRFF